LPMVPVFAGKGVVSFAAVCGWRSVGRTASDGGAVAPALPLEATAVDGR